jgi:hypothetical protein
MTKRTVTITMLAGLALMPAAAAGAAPNPCAAAVHRAEHQIFSWPHGFSGVGLRQAAMLHLRAAAQAGESGNEQLCWGELAQSGYVGG